MLDPCISVAIITYNQEQYIAQALESILSQQVDFSYEVVIGEDCSTDNTREIVKDYKNRYPTAVRFVTSDSNVGMMKNLVRTMQACRGKYIAFCEGDDYWTDVRKLEKQLLFMLDNTSLSMSFHGVQFEYMDGSRPFQIMRSFKGNKILIPKEVILGGGDIFKFTTTLIRRDVVENLPQWYEKSPVTDAPLALIAATKGNVGYLDEVMSVYRYHTASSWSTRVSKTFEKRLEYVVGMAQMRKEFDKYSEFRYSGWIKQRTSSNYRRILLRKEIDGNRRKFLYKEYKDDMVLLDRLIIKLACFMNFPLFRSILIRNLRRFFGISEF